MKEIKTLVYFDLEATGLKNSGRPRITEISLIAVNIQDLLELHMKIMQLLGNGKEEDSKLNLESLLPRIVNKLTLCVYPMANIVPTVSDITGLDNYMLSDYSSFDINIGNLLNSFLVNLPSPVCLVAHNGDLYDFPLLKAELQNAGTSLNPSILCADSYAGIKDIYKKKEDAIQAEHVRKQNVKIYEEMKIITEELRAVNDMIIAGEFETEMEINHCDDLRPCVISLTPDSGRLSSLTKPLSSQVGEVKQLAGIPMEITPNRTYTILPTNIHPHKLKQNSFSEEFKSRRKLNFSLPSSPKSFSLINLHTFLLGFTPSKSHGAEADCLTLLRTTAVLGKDWLDWVKENTSSFADSRAMWGRTSKN
jgi:DNA polymerase III epsilon subunit-like protein